MSYSKVFKQAEKEFDLNKGDRFKFKEGANKIRLVSEALPHASTYKGQPTFKFLVYIIDRTDEKIKLLFCPTTVMKQIADLQQSDDYGFDDLPPYDITVTATNAGDVSVKYSVQAARQDTPLTAEEKQRIEALKPLEKVRENLASKQEKTVTAPNIEPDENIEITDEDIPY